MSDFSLFGDIDLNSFFAEYWQQRPLLIRQAIPNFTSPINADELAGLAMEDFVESRLVKTEGWQVEHGPFNETTFSALGESPWSLLVQGVDQMVPDVASLLNRFRFLPSWRLDDIMVSFATDGGGVGPHFDHYDVFLLQAAGKRQWKIGGMCESEQELISDCELAILKNFNCCQEYLLEPGDMLYLPPKLAHWGIAKGDCMTYSIGFRAPSVREIVSEFCDDRLEALPLTERYRDKNLDKNQNTYRISDVVINQLRESLLSVVDDKVALANWFGRYTTTPRYELEPEGDADNNEKANKTFERAIGARLAFYGQGDSVTLFANGQSYEVSLFFAEFICEHEEIPQADLEKVTQTPGDARAWRELVAIGLYSIR